MRFDSNLKLNIKQKINWKEFDFGSLVSFDGKFLTLGGLKFERYLICQF